MATEKISFEKNHVQLKTAAIDWADLYGRIPDESLIVQFAASFAESTPPLVSALEQSLAGGDGSQVEGNAHALKGAAANLGAVSLARAAWRLEQAARQQRQAEWVSLFEHIRTEYARLVELLSHPDWVEIAKHASKHEQA